MGEFWKMVGAIVMFLVLVAAIAFGIWAKVAAPCKDIGWLPVKEMPARCLTFVRQ